MNNMDFVSFDPQVGFVLTSKMLGGGRLDADYAQRVFGRYKCVVEGEEDVFYTLYDVEEGSPYITSVSLMQFSNILLYCKKTADS